MVIAASVLVIDEDSSLAKAAQPILLRIGYRLDHARPGDLDLRHLQRDPPDIVVVRISRQHDDWFFYRQLLSLLPEPRLLLLDADSKPLQVPEGGACLLLVRSLHLIEQVARTRASLPGEPYSRRRPNFGFFVDAELAVDLVRGEVRREGRLVALTPTEFRLLASFLRHLGIFRPHESLLRELWGPWHGRGPSALRPHIHNLRQKLEPDPGRPQRIVTCHGKGYLFQRLEER